MPSPFDEHDAAMQAAIAAHFGEGIRIRPMAGDVNYGGAADPTRSVAEIRAIPSKDAKIGTTDFNNSNRNGGAVATAPAEVWIAREDYAALGYRLVRGDVIELIEGGTPPPAYKVAAVHDGDFDDVLVILTG